jgi:nitrogen-specific signal transduction histidine kinase
MPTRNVVLTDHQADLVERLRTLSVDINPMLRWEVDLPPGIGLRADQDQIFRILANLTRNAADGYGGNLTVLRVEYELV